MSDQNQEAREDNFADACAAIAILSITISTVVFWLAGMPS
ncbi:methionine synthase [Spongiibacter sp.]